jgi:putative holliday junction resolvase
MAREVTAVSRLLPLRAFIDEIVSGSLISTRIGGLDFGTKSIGVATTDEMRMSSFPYGTIEVKRPPKSQESLTDLSRKLCEFSCREDVSHFVVGFPLMKGTDRKLTPLCDHILWSLSNLPRINELKSVECLTFCFWDEAYSTSEARRVIKSTSARRSVVLKHKDSVAAAIILQSFLEYAYASNNKAYGSRCSDLDPR